MLGFHNLTKFSFVKVCKGQKIEKIEVLTGSPVDLSKPAKPKQHNSDKRFQLHRSLHMVVE